MKLKVLKSHLLSKEEQRTINAGTAPDCEPGEVLVQNGLVWECREISTLGDGPITCSWGLGHDGDDETPGDNSGHGW